MLCINYPFDVLDVVEAVLWVLDLGREPEILLHSEQLQQMVLLGYGAHLQVFPVGALEVDVARDAISQLACQTIQQCCLAGAWKVSVVRSQKRHTDRRAVR